MLRDDKRDYDERLTAARPRATRRDRRQPRRTGAGRSPRRAQPSARFASASNLGLCDSVKKAVPPGDYWNETARCFNEQAELMLATFDSTSQAMLTTRCGCRDSRVSTS